VSERLSAHSEQSAELRDNCEIELFLVQMRDRWFEMRRVLQQGAVSAQAHCITQRGRRSQEI